MSKAEDAIARDPAGDAAEPPHGTQEETASEAESAAQNDTSQEPEAPAVTRTGPLTEAALFGRQTPPAAPAPPEAAPHVHPPGAGSSYRALAGLLISYALLIVGNGLFQTLIPLRIMQSGYPTIVIGLVQSCYYAGFILGAMVNRRLIDRIGQHRTFVAYSAAASILALAFGAAQSPWTLALVRLLTGFAFMGLYVSIESWLNGTVENEKRGQVFGTYAAINYLAVGSGQFLLNFGAGMGGQQFSIAAALFAAAVMPVTLLEGWPVKVADESLHRVPARTWRESVRDMMAAAPLAVPGCVLAGFIYSAFYAMMPVYLQRAGFSTSELATFMGVALIGALVPQWPMGRLSDRFDRRRLVYITASISATLSLVLFCIDVRVVTWCATLAYVAVTFTQYGLIVSHVQDRTEPHHRVAISATLLALFSFGGMAGPALASSLMTVVGPSGLFLFNALSCVLLALSARRALGIHLRGAHAGA
ncbi:MULTISPECIES: MFS transporter [unclassified Caballeronia]|uniref:MFS transporter n=1 Tax=unclassified Caballeronia TaxID=2646786 RepID=UPI0028562C57|nr:MULTISPECIES: MFS transporter [unclassified Caballeronia]MDR5822752.1 MFS transporter [Caballeronia sp. LZ043]MDR5880805.1 MFS transporter [Caballeronia sp. LZ032]